MSYEDFQEEYWEKDYDPLDDYHDEENEIITSPRVNTIFDLDDEICGITVITHDNVVKVPASYIDSISEKLKTLACKESKEIDVSELKVTWESVQQAISFYHPQNYIKFTDEDQFAELLALCDEWELDAFRKSIEEYLTQDHKSGLEHFNGELDCNHIDILHICERFKLENILNGFMTGLTKTTDPFSLWKSDRMKDISKEVQFEIWKVQMENLLTQTNDKSEFYAIINFFNFLIYEDRVVDQYAEKKFKKQIEYGIYEKIKQSDFEEKKFGTDVTIIVSGTKLYVSSHILIKSSPVFKRRLENLGDKELILELPWKNIKEVLLFLTFLTKPCEIDGDVDLYALTSICQEYQVQWIIDKIGNYIAEEIEFGDETYQSQLRLLKLVSMMGFDYTRKELIQVLNEPFQVLKMTEEFTWLNKSTKILVARKCLFELGKKNIVLFYSKLSYRKKFKLLTNKESFALMNVLEKYAQDEIFFDINEEMKSLSAEIEEIQWNSE
ncbi:uncharacterized protein [Clytia hemisphaerica]